MVIGRESVPYRAVLACARTALLPSTRDPLAGVASDRQIASPGRREPVALLESANRLRSASHAGLLSGSPQASSSLARLPGLHLPILAPRLPRARACGLTRRAGLPDIWRLSAPFALHRGRRVRLRWPVLRAGADGVQTQTSTVVASPCGYLAAAPARLSLSGACAHEDAVRMYAEPWRNDVAARIPAARILGRLPSPSGAAYREALRTEAYAPIWVVPDLLAVLTCFGGGPLRAPDPSLKAGRIRHPPP
jgi:hypothetical protein